MGCTSLLLADEGNGEVLEKIKLAMKIKLPDTARLEVREAPVPGMYEVVADDRLFYVDGTVRYLFLGQIYDMQEKVDLTAARQGDLAGTAEVSTSNIAWEYLPHDHAIVLKEGAPHKLGKFADPLCHHCARQHKVLSGMKDVEVRVFLFPVFGDGSSVQMVQTVLCSEDRASALEAAYQGRLEINVPADCNHESFDVLRTFTQENGINATPMLVRGDGTVVPGGRSAAFIESWVRGNQK